ncbi:hypothetical protein MAR_009713 [Mya arenaria]|uniref:Uncharacterized protein n=1 Tax=Mya arenaria TaxID=6604 RepID=A0ABY7DZI5_MYAAR|nr:hypothetical protein MAR_009713 [Mya arenaria]
MLPKFINKKTGKSFVLHSVIKTIHYTSKYCVSSGTTNRKESYLSRLVELSSHITTTGKTAQNSQDQQHGTNRKPVSNTAPAGNQSVIWHQQGTNQQIGITGTLKSALRHQGTTHEHVRDTHTVHGLAGGRQANQDEGPYAFIQQECWVCGHFRVSCEQIVAHADVLEWRAGHIGCGVK